VLKLKSEAYNFTVILVVESEEIKSISQIGLILTKRIPSCTCDKKGGGSLSDFLGNYP
jgi:hypothetical protein